MTLVQPDSDVNGTTHSTPPAQPEVVGLIPAAGRASRLGSLPMSKEVLPSGRHQRPVAAYLIDQMRNAGASRLFFILREGKWDIPENFGDGRDHQIPIGYLMMNDPWGPPFTLNQATPFTTGCNVLIGFPDILIAPEDAFERVLRVLNRTGADAVLGTFAAKRDDGCDLVTIDNNQRVSAVIPKEKSPQWDEQSRTWLFAAWSPTFTAYFSRRVSELAKLAKSLPTEPLPEWPVGSILADAIADGLDLRSVHFEDGQFLDIGEPDRLARARTFPER